MARVRPGEAANPAPPTVQRIRVRFAKRGRLRFLSHRDVARSVERAVRRAGIPVAHSHGFSPHPRLSWIGAAPTGAASEAEYLEIGLTRPLDPAGLAAALDAALPDGIDVLAAAVAEGTPLADRIDASELAHRTARCHPRRPARSRRRPAGGRGRRRGAGDARRGGGRSTCGPHSSARRCRRLPPGCGGLCDNDGGRAADDTRRATRRRVGRARCCRRSQAPGSRKGDPDGSGPARSTGAASPTRSARTGLPPAPDRSRSALRRLGGMARRRARPRPDRPGRAGTPAAQDCSPAHRSGRSARAPAWPPPGEAPGGGGVACRTSIRPPVPPAGRFPYPASATCPRSCGSRPRQAPRPHQPGGDGGAAGLGFAARTSQSSVDRKTAEQVAVVLVPELAGGAEPRVPGATC